MILARPDPRRRFKKSKSIRPKVVAKVRRTSAQAYTSNWEKISEEAMKRDGYRCRECGAPRSEKRLEVHHVIPISDGGKTVLYNLRTLCCDCHNKKPGHSHMKNSKVRFVR